MAGARVKTGDKATDRSLADVWRRLDRLERAQPQRRVLKYSALDLTNVTGGGYSNVTKDDDGALVTATANTNVKLPLVLDVGEKLISVRALVLGTAAGLIEMSLRRTSVIGGAATVLTAVSNAKAAQAEILSIANLAEEVLADLASYFVRFAFTTAAGQKVFTVAIETELT